MILSSWEPVLSSLSLLHHCEHFALKSSIRIEQVGDCRECLKGEDLDWYKLYLALYEFQTCEDMWRIIIFFAKTHAMYISWTHFTFNSKRCVTSSHTEASILAFIFHGVIVIRACLCFIYRGSVPTNMFETGWRIW